MLGFFPEETGQTTKNVVLVLAFWSPLTAARSPLFFSRFFINPVSGRGVNTERRAFFLWCLVR